MSSKEIYNIDGMNDIQIVNIIKNIFKIHNRCGGMRVVKAKANKCLVDFVMRATSYFDADPIYSFVNLQTRCYMVINDLSEDDFPRCETCGEIIKANVISVKQGFPYKTCSQSCAALNPKRSEKIAATNISRGHPPKWSNPEKAKKTQAMKPQSQKDIEIARQKATVQLHVKEDPEYWNNRLKKAKDTKVANGHDPNWNNSQQISATKKKKGKEDPEYWSNIRKKYNATNIANGHDPNWNNREQCAKTIQLCEKEDPEYWSKIDVKRKATKVANGHDPNWNNSNLRKQTCLDTYGVENYAQTDECSKQFHKTCLERYGHESPMQCPEINQKAIITKQTKIFQQICSDNCEVEPLFSLDEFLKRTKDQMFQWRCKKCGTIFESRVNLVYARSKEANGTFARCLKCHPIQIRSGQQLEVKEFISSLIGEHLISYNNRKAIAPKEIDIYIPKMQIGFEYDGIYWHSAMASVDPLAARKKSDYCYATNIKLFRIYEDDWRYKNDVVKLELKKALMLDAKKIDLKVCSLCNCTYDQALDFLQHNSLLRMHHRTKLNLFLMQNEIPIATMMANIGKGKLLVSAFATSVATKNTKDIFKTMLNFTIANSRLKAGTCIQIKISKDWPLLSEIVRDAGFNIQQETSPSSYVADCKSWSRLLKNPTKKNVQSLLKITINQSKTLLENLHDNDFTIIYDAGNLVFTKII